MKEPAVSGGEAAEPSAQVDARGLLCPLPILRAQAAMRRLPPGGLLVLLADDPAIRDDLPAWCDGQRHELLSLEQVITSGRPAFRGRVRKQHRGG